MTGEYLARCGRPHAPGATLQQRHAAVRFQKLDALGGCRGRYPATVSRAGDAPQLQSGKKDPERDPVWRCRHPPCLPERAAFPAIVIASLASANANASSANQRFSAMPVDAGSA